jgi:hypothetical protein
MGTAAIVMLTGSWLKFNEMSLFAACVKLRYCVYKCCITYFTFYHFTCGIDVLIFYISFIDVSLRMVIYY